MFRQLIPIGLVGLYACSEKFPEEVHPVSPVPVVPDAGEAGADAGSVKYDVCPGGYSGACAKIPMPLDWKDPSGKTIDILIDKISSSRAPKVQLWLLQGGPGGSAADMVPFGEEFAQKIDDLEVFSIEHRGVGASNRLGCPNAEKGANAAADGGAPQVDSVTCASEAIALYGADLQHYTTTNAAKDLARAIELTRRPGVKVVVSGGSYGTYWAQRLMQVAPTAADGGVILDSMVVPGKQFLSNFDPQVDVVAAKLGELCKADAACNAELGPDPWAKIQAAKTKIDQGACPELGLTPLDRAKITVLMRAHPFMSYAFAAWARIDRCTTDDVAAVKKLLSRLPFQGPNDRLASGVLGANIAFSELFESPPPSSDTMKKRFDDAVFPAGTYYDFASYGIWPKYTPDEFVGKMPDPKVPVLVLAGTLDTQTPIELQLTAKDHYTGPGLTFVTVPNANHGVLAQSPLFAAAGPPEQCGMRIAVSFIANPNAPDTSCASMVLAPPFTHGSDEVSFFFGKTDPWVALPPHAVVPMLTRGR